MDPIDSAWSTTNGTTQAQTAKQEKRTDIMYEQTKQCSRMHISITVYANGFKMQVANVMMHIKGLLKDQQRHFQETKVMLLTASAAKSQIDIVERVNAV